MSEQREQNACDWRGRLPAGRDTRGRQGRPDGQEVAGQRAALPLTDRQREWQAAF